MSLLRKPIKFHKNLKTKILTNVRTLHERVQTTNKNTKVKNQFSTIPQIVRQGSDYLKKNKKNREFLTNFYKLEFRKIKILDCAQSWGTYKISIKTFP